MITTPFTKFSEMNIKAQVMLHNMTMEMVMELSRAGIQSSMLHDQIVIKARNKQEAEKALKICQDLYDREEAGNQNES